MTTNCVEQFKGVNIYIKSSIKKSRNTLQLEWCCKPERDKIKTLNRVELTFLKLTDMSALKIGSSPQTDPTTNQQRVSASEFTP